MVANKKEGARKWYFPDGYLPGVDQEAIVKSHESICILNAGEKTANVTITIFFEDRSPVEDIHLQVEPMRDVHIRLDKPDQIGGNQIPQETPYGLRLVSDRKIIAQLSRMDARGGNLAMFTTLGYWED